MASSTGPGPPSSEAELESYVEVDSTLIFGEDSLYFPVKTRLRSLGMDRLV